MSRSRDGTATSRSGRRPSPRARSISRRRTNGLLPARRNSRPWDPPWTRRKPASRNSSAREARGLRRRKQKSLRKLNRSAPAWKTSRGGRPASRRNAGRSPGIRNSSNRVGWPWSRVKRTCPDGRRRSPRRPRPWAPAKRRSDPGRQTSRNGNHPFHGASLRYRSKGTP